MNGNEVTQEHVLKKNSRERLKKEKRPLDVIHELPSLIQRGYEDISEDDIVRLQWYGLYHNKPKVGEFMMRIKIPNGILTPQKLLTIGEISQRYGQGYGEITTRQDIQLHSIRLAHLPALFETLKQGGLSTVGGCGDVVRNITGCPVAGIDRRELFDVRPVVVQLARFLDGNREYSDLPRKHKITVASCPSQCNLPEIHCQAYIGVKHEHQGKERLGFAVRVGGGLSTVPRISKPLGVFVEVEEVLPLVRAILDVWKDDLTYRRSFIKARLKFMIDDLGVEEFRRRVEDRLGGKLVDFPECPTPDSETNHLDVNEQRQAGLYYIGFPVLVGRITGERMIQVARLMEHEGGDIRLTQQQNLILTHIAKERVLKAVLLQGTHMIEIDVEEKEILDHEIERLMIPLSPDSKARQDYAQLLTELGSGVISEELVMALEHVLEITLSTGRIRDAYGPQEEQQLLRLYHRTPTGTRSREHIKQVNQSLDALKDQKIESLSFSLKTPGAYRLELNTDQCQLTINVDWSGVSIHQLVVDI